MPSVANAGIERRRTQTFNFLPQCYSSTSYSITPNGLQCLSGAIIVEGAQIRFCSLVQQAPNGSINRAAA
jgi:hypothetical protein